MLKSILAIHGLRTLDACVVSVLMPVFVFSYPVYYTFTFVLYLCLVTSAGESASTFPLYTPSSDIFCLYTLASCPVGFVSILV